MENSGFLKTVIVVLLFINIGTLTFMWIERPRHSMPPPPPDTAAFLNQELHFTSYQQNRFDRLREEHHRAVEELRDKSKIFHDELFDQIKKNPVDSIHVNSITDSITATQKKIELITFYHFQKVRSICTGEQQVKFDEVIGEAIRMMSPGPPGRR